MTAILGNNAKCVKVLVTKGALLDLQNKVGEYNAISMRFNMKVWV